MQAIDTGCGVKGMVFRGDEVLVLLNPNGGYDLPGGRLEGNETCLAGLRREILEETGIKKVVVTNSSAPWSFRKESGRLIKGTTWVCHYVAGEVSLSSEHSGFTWRLASQMKDLDIYHKYGLENLILGFTK
jgi:8-oxo-dGTP diphosphatase